MSLRNTMEHMTLQNISTACGGRYMGDASCMDEEITGVVRDNREVEPGNLFIAIKGERVDGHSFIEDAFRRGAIAVLSEQELPDSPGPYILVSSTTEAMKKLAAFYRESLSIPVVGITGSVGKTSTKEMIASVLEQKYKVAKTKGNYNNEIGLPLTIFQIRREHEVAVLEMGISDFGEMHRLADMAKPNIGVITNIGWCHLENLKTQEGILQAKTEMLSHMSSGGTVILNGDDEKLVTVTPEEGQKLVFYGISEKIPETERMKIPQIYATQVQNLGFDGMRANIHTPEGDFFVSIAIPGEHNVYNALAATAVGLSLGLTLSQIQAGIEAARTIQGRTNLLKVHDMTIIDDCYNANPVSMKASIEVLSHAGGRRIAVLGDMGELGETERQLHNEVGRFVGTHGIPVLFCAGELAFEYVKGVQETNPECEVHYFPNREEMTRELVSFVKAGDTVLIKASHFMEFPKVVEALS